MCRGNFPRHERHITWACRTECTSGHRYSFCPGTRRHSCPGGCSWQSTAASCTQPSSVPSSSSPLSLWFDERPVSERNRLAFSRFAEATLPRKILAEPRPFRHLRTMGGLRPFSPVFGRNGHFPCEKTGKAEFCRDFGIRCIDLSRAAEVLLPRFFVKISVFRRISPIFLSLAIRSRPFPRPFRAPVC